MEQVATTGLGFGESQPVPRRQWQFVNTDDMHLSWQKVETRFGKSVPLLNGAPVSPVEYVPELVDGFEQMYRFLMARREALLAPDGPLVALDKQKVRFVFRTTNIYSKILENSLAPIYLQNGADWSIELESLSCAFLQSQEKPSVWTIFRAELRAMEQLDIPYFGTTTDSDTLKYGLQEPLEACFPGSSYEKLLTRLQHLDETDLARQVEIIHGAVFPSEARKHAQEDASPSAGCR